MLFFLQSALAWPTDWTTIDQGGSALTDTSNDQISSDEQVDLVGSSAFPAGYWSMDDDTLYLRMRINETPWTQVDVALQKGAWGVGLDLDGDSRRAAPRRAAPRNLRTALCEVQSAAPWPPPGQSALV